MGINELIGLIGNVGFPVAISAYLLIRLEKQMGTLAASINKLNTIISTKLGVVIDSTGPNDDSNKVAWRKAINIYILMFIAFKVDYIYER